METGLYCVMMLNYDAEISCGRGWDCLGWRVVENTCLLSCSDARPKVTITRFQVDVILRAL